MNGCVCSKIVLNSEILYYYVELLHCKITLFSTQALNMTTIAMEEYELMKDSKYRMYVAAVDKALKNFEYTSEWPDLISALGKLNKVRCVLIIFYSIIILLCFKVLLNYTKFPVIPRRIKISKRLAQCMHPALPSGVHLKALETYDVIFKCMGTNRLSHELFIYSAGIFIH